MRRIATTTNNPTSDYLDHFEKAKDVCNYIVAAEEVGESGTRHYQSYFEFIKPQSLKQCTELLPGTHISKCMGNQNANINYVKKGDQPKDEWTEHKSLGPNYGRNLKLVFEWGEPKTQGKRNDLAPIIASCAAGMGLRAMAEEHPEAFIKHCKGITAYHQALALPRSSSVAKEVIVLFGPTGCGKTRQAYDAHPDAYLWGPEQSKWFDKYDGHRTVIMDEFRGQLPFGYLLRLLDRYPMKVEMKGSVCEFVADKIIITSPVHPSKWYDLELKEGAIDQLLRRITTITDLSPPIMVEFGVPQPESQF